MNEMTKASVSIALLAIVGCHSMHKQSSTLIVPETTANFPEMKSAILAFEKNPSATAELKTWFEQQPKVTLQTAAVTARKEKNDKLLPDLYKALNVTDAQRIAAFAPLLGSPDAISIATAKKNLDGIPSEAFVPYMAENGRSGDLVDPIVAYLFGKSREEGMTRAMEMNKGVDDERMAEVAKLVQTIRDAKSPGSQAAKSALQTLSTQKEWWIRGYVLMTMKQQPALADKDLIEKLEKDENNRVYRLLKPWVNHS
jgi:hypothetical protein